ncbi:MAG: nitrile hydratase subunit beta [Burkholderiales bacterium]
MPKVHDLGGDLSFGEIYREEDEPAFHNEWEGRVLGLQRSILSLGVWNIDVFRHAQEQISEEEYLSWSYYERWINTLSSTAVVKGLVSIAELEACRSNGDIDEALKPLDIKNINKAFMRGNFERPTNRKPCFSVGSKVKTLIIESSGHTRLPKYAQDKIGVVEAIRGCHVYPDAVVSEGSESPHWLYTLVFSASELWGGRADHQSTVSIDAFEPYLKPAT